MEENKQTKCDNPCACSDGDEEQCHAQSESIEQMVPEPEQREDEYVRNPQYGRAECDKEPIEEPIIEVIQHHPEH